MSTPEIRDVTEEVKRLLPLEVCDEPQLVKSWSIKPHGSASESANISVYRIHILGDIYYVVSYYDGTIEVMHGIGRDIKEALEAAAGKWKIHGIPDNLNEFLLILKHINGGEHE